MLLDGEAANSPQAPLLTAQVDDALPQQTEPDRVQDFATLARQYAAQHLAARRDLGDLPTARHELLGVHGAERQERMLDQLGELVSHLEPLAPSLKREPGPARFDGLGFGDFCLGRAAAVLTSRLLAPDWTIEPYDVHGLRRLTDSLFVSGARDTKHGLWAAGIRAACADGVEVDDVYFAPVARGPQGRKRGSVSASLSRIAQNGGRMPLPAPDRPHPAANSLNGRRPVTK